MQTFNQMYFMDLHGNTKKKERTPEGGKDENVFDIEQGVAVSLLVKKQGLSRAVYHADLWGTRKEKYRALLEVEKDSVKWQELHPSMTPFYLFIPHNEVLWPEYEQGWQVTDIFSKNVLGFQTHRDHFAIAYEKSDIEQRVKDMVDEHVTDRTLQEKYTIQDTRDWHISEARNLLQASDNQTQSVIPCSYRPFDTRWCFFGYEFMDYPRRDFLEHCHLKSNVILGVGRAGNAVPERPWELVTIADTPVDANIFRRGGVDAFPLYLYPPSEGREKSKSRLSFEETDPFQDKERIENLSPEFRAFIDAKYKHQYSPEEILGYIYAVLHSPTYRQKYLDFLKIDFPYIPFVNQRKTFEALSTLGWALIQAHLLKTIPDTLTVDVTAGHFEAENPRYDPQQERLHINKTQYFSPVPADVWAFHIGGYQVLDKYLKARKGRMLALDEIENVQKVVNVLRFTIDQMQRIDERWKA